jgi:hypothetical protein
MNESLLSAFQPSRLLTDEERVEALLLVSSWPDTDPATRAELEQELRERFGLARTWPEQSLSGRTRAPLPVEKRVADLEKRVAELEREVKGLRKYPRR